MPRSPVTDFYPSNTEEFEKLVGALLSSAKASEKRRALGIVVPHGGSDCAGPTAAAVFARLLPDFDAAIIIGPNHTDVGEPLAISADGWETPSGTIEGDGALRRALAKNFSVLKEDEVAHEYDHSIEALLPLLQRTSSNAKIVPIIIARPLASLENCELLGDAIARAIGKKRVLIVASSNLGHAEASPSEEETKERHETVKKADGELLEAIAAGDAKKVFEVGHKSGACGHTAIATLLFALGGRSKKATVVSRTTNYDAGCTKHREKIVGYAGVIFE